MIIYGWKQYARVLAVLTLVCQQCAMPAEHVLRRLTTKVTLFFIPLFPIARKRTLQCGACQHEVRIPKEQADQLAMSAAGPGPMPPPQRQPQPQPAYGPPPGYQQGPPRFQPGPPPPMQPPHPQQPYGPPPGYQQGPPPMRQPYPPQQQPYPPPNYPYGR